MSDPILDTNLFKFPDPQDWFCHVDWFTKSHNLLRIMVYKRTFKNMHFLEFRKVTLFSAPMLWRGTNFYIAPAEEKVSVIRSWVALYDDVTNDEVDGKYGDYRLYVGQATDVRQKILILANAAQKLDKDENTLLEAY